MSPETKDNLKTGGIITTVVLVGGMLAGSVDWVIKKNNEIGVSQDQQDSIVVALKRSETRIRRLEKALGIKPGAKLPEVPQRVGFLRRFKDIVW